MGPAEADLGPNVRVNLSLMGITQMPVQGPPLRHREQSEVEGWILEILYMYCDPKGSRAFLRIASTGVPRS